MVMIEDVFKKNDLKRAVNDTDCNPFIKLILTRCIHCTRCVRFLREIAGDYSLGMLGSGQLSEIGLYTSNILTNELSSNIIDFCPVGALTNKNFALNYRSWDSHYIDSIDIMDTFLSSIRIYTDNLKIKRILSNYNNNFDVYWISDKSRYFFDSLKIQRLTFPLILKKNNLISNNKNNNFFYCK
jgi:NADH dehydrogenase/NADH:ubiquinone oxidoreductase subunit G